MDKCLEALKKSPITKYLLVWESKKSSLAGDAKFVYKLCLITSGLMFKRHKKKNPRIF